MQTTAAPKETDTLTAQTQPSVAACVSAASWADAIQAAAAHLTARVGPVLAVARPDGATIAVSPVNGSLDDATRDSVGRAAAAAFVCGDGWALERGHFAVRSVVVREDGEAVEALVGVVQSNATPEANLMAVSAALSAASSRDLAIDQRREAETAGRVIDVTDRLQTAIDETDLYERLAEASRVTLDAEWVVVGTRRGDHFEVATHDPAGTELSDDERASIEAAMDETHVLGTPCSWPPTNVMDRPARRAIERACAVRGFESMWVLPLEDARGCVETMIVAWSVSTSESIERLCAYWNPTVGATVAAVRDARAGWWVRLKSLVSEATTGRGLKIFGGVAALAAVILAIPMPYKPKCECRLEPSLRRFVAAPFNATLKTVHVDPGDMVTSGGVLAELDEREIDFELAGIEAELRQASKRRDAALATATLAEAQIAEFDGERLSARRDLLIGRQGRLALRSPLDGIVVDGDLSRAEGMPVETGQSLFEVAPLDAFVCEVHVPEFDIEDVAVGQSVAMSLDARPGETLHGVIRRIRPRADVWDDSVGFVAEVEIANVDGTLRPGMTGDARVTTDWHPVGRNLFHRAYGQWRRGW